MTRKCIYGIYDEKLGNYVQVVLLEDSEVDSYFTHVANDVSSPYFTHEKDFSIYRLYELDSLGTSDESINCLNEYVDESVRNLQVITRTLNYLPIGYFKMPKEMQQSVEQDIKNAVYDYVANYLSDDNKLAISKVIKED